MKLKLLFPHLPGILLPLWDVSRLGQIQCIQLSLKICCYMWNCDPSVRKFDLGMRKSCFKILCLLTNALELFEYFDIPTFWLTRRSCGTVYESGSFRTDDWVASFQLESCRTWNWNWCSHINRECCCRCEMFPGWVKSSACSFLWRSFFMKYKEISEGKCYLW